jgi:pimeloyl-ACP methyl ester carboxylesterase
VELLVINGFQLSRLTPTGPAPRLAERTRTCFYDRLGNGASDKPTGCRRMNDLRGDLEALLRALGEKGRYVLVGHSWVAS